MLSCVVYCVIWDFPFTCCALVIIKLQYYPPHSIALRIK